MPLGKVSEEWVSDLRAQIKARARQGLGDHGTARQGGDQAIRSSPNENSDGQRSSVMLDNSTKILNAVKDIHVLLLLDEKEPRPH